MSGSLPPPLNDRLLVGVIALALLLRIGMLLFLNPFSWDERQQQSQGYLDDWNYHERALLILAGWTSADFRPYGDESAYRNPGYPLFVAAHYLLFGKGAWRVFVTQIIFDAAVAGLTYLLTLAVYPSRRASAAAGILYAADPTAIVYSCTMRSDAPYLLPLTLSLYLYARARKAASLRDHALVGLALGLATMVRPVGSFFLAVPLALTLAGARDGNAAKTRVGLASTMLVAYLLVLSPWLYRNYQAYGHFSMNSQEGDSICDYNAALLRNCVENGCTGDYNKMSPCRGIKADNPFELSEMKQRIAVSYISKHPLEYSMLVLKGATHYILRSPDLMAREAIPIIGNGLKARGISQRQYFPAADSILTPAITVKSALFCLGAAFILASAGLRSGCLILLLAVAYFALATGPLSQMMDRFVLPALPFMSAVSAIGLSESGRTAARLMAKKDRGNPNPPAP